MIPHEANFDYLVDRYFSAVSSNHERRHIQYVLDNPNEIAVLLGLPPKGDRESQRISIHRYDNQQILKDIVFFQSLVEIAIFSGFVRGPLPTRHLDAFEELRPLFLDYVDRTLGNNLPRRLAERIEREEWNVPDDSSGFLCTSFIRALHLIGEASLDRNFIQLSEMNVSRDGPGVRSKLIAIFSDVDKIATAFKDNGDSALSEIASQVIATFHVVDQIEAMSVLVGEISNTVNEEMGNMTWHLLRVLLGPLSNNLDDFLIRAFECMQLACAGSSNEASRDLSFVVDMLRRLKDGPIRSLRWTMSRADMERFFEAIKTEDAVASVEEGMTKLEIFEADDPEEHPAH